MKRFMAIVAAVWLTGIGHAAAQAVSNGSTEDRPATTSVTGDTGIWFVSTGEVLPAGRWSFSFARTETDFDQGFTDVSSWPVSVGVGIGNRAEVFGSLRAVTRVDRDTRPLFFQGADNEPGGLVNDFPSARESWSGNKFGDLLIGGKINLLSEQRLQPLALAVRATTKIPTGDEESGASTGSWDWFLDAIASKEIRGRVEVAGFTGLAWRGDPEGINLTDGLRWGVGASFPSRGRVRVTSELHGEFEFDDEVIAQPGFLVATDGTLAPTLSNIQSPLNLSAGLTLQSTAGTFFDVGVVYAFGINNRSDFGSQFSDDAGDAVGIQFRVGWHRGVHRYVPPVAIAAAPPVQPPQPEPAPAPPLNRVPTVRLECNPCVIESGRTLSVRGIGQDADGDPLSYRWSVPAGTLSGNSGSAVTWTAPSTPGAVALTVTADDGKGGLASDTVTINVMERAVGTTGVADPRDIALEDVHFEFDRYTLRKEAAQTLEAAIDALKRNPVFGLTIEGHTCNIGTAEYNMALGERRAAAVREYLISRGIATERLYTVSYGEERPKHDNSKDPPRRFNRRAAMILRVTTTQP